MKPLFFSLLFLLPLLVAAPVKAQIAGKWHVTGQISGKAFTVDCQFTPTNTTDFGGACIDAANGKSHVLTSGSIAGNHVQWAYPASFMMMSFAVDFQGTLDNGRISGPVVASGHKGAFTASRE